MAGGPTSVFSEGREKLDAAFRAAGRAERPRALAGSFFSLGEDAEAEARRGLGAYFAAEPDLAEPIIADALTGAGAIRETLEEFERRGCDDFLLFPASADPAQVDLLAAAVDRLVEDKQARVAEQCGSDLLRTVDRRLGGGVLAEVDPCQVGAGGDL
jgi:hypothetical protein